MTRRPGGGGRDPKPWKPSSSTEGVNQLAGPIGAEVAVHHDVAVAQPAIDPVDDARLHELVVLIPGIGRSDASLADAAARPIPWTIAW
jgi:hypothetical protein